MMPTVPCVNADRLRELLALPADAVARRDLDTHLSTCERCRRVLLDVTAEAVRALPGSEVTVTADQSLGNTAGSPTRSGPSASPTRLRELAVLDPPTDPGHLGRLAHYELLEVVGRGGMGTVFKAVDETLHRTVALKLMSPELAASPAARQRFIREARAAAAVAHENVVVIHAVDDSRALPFLVLQLVEGTSLQERLAGGPLPVAEAVRIARQTAAGLAAAHAKGLIHRDIKPGNILLEAPEGRVKITDFGLARAADDASVSQSGAVVGTPLYMSPEQARGETLGHRSDLFSLGSVLYAMCTGDPPFRAGNAMAVMKRVCDDAPVSPRVFNPAVPPWLESVILRLLSKDPTQRFGSAAEVVRALDAGVAPVRDDDTLPIAEPVPTPARRSRRPYLIGAAALLAAVVIVVVIVANRGGRERPQQGGGTPAVRKDAPDEAAAPGTTININVPGGFFPGGDPKQMPFPDPETLMKMSAEWQKMMENHPFLKDHTKTGDAKPPGAGRFGQFGPNSFGNLGVPAPKGPGRP
jgi:hypothetical protein